MAPLFQILPRGRPRDMTAVENVGTSTGHVSRKASAKLGGVSREFLILTKGIFFPGSDSGSQSPGITNWHHLKGHKFISPWLLCAPLFW